jgi:hypothetical protein
MRFWTIRRRRNVFAAGAAMLVALFPLAAQAYLRVDPHVLYRQMTTAYDRGTSDGWHLADELDYFSTVLDAGRAYELRMRDDPENTALKGITVDLATRLNYDALTNRDAAEWYVRLAAEQYADDPARGPAAKALLAKLDREDASVAALAHDADADVLANAKDFPGDVEALLDVVEADMEAYGLTQDTSYRSLALQRAAQTAFPVGLLPPDVANRLLPQAEAARAGAAGYSADDARAAVALLSHRASAHVIPTIGHVLSHQAYLVITAPADEYFGHTKLSPLGFRNEIVRIGKYLDVGWGSRMSGDAVYLVDALDDWRQQYPRDYELPRLLLQTYTLLGRIDSPSAVAARAKVRTILTVEYNSSAEARSLLAS